MAIIILPDAQEDIKALRRYMIRKWNLPIWVDAKREIFSRFEAIQSGKLNGFQIPELASLGSNTYQQTLTSHHRIVYEKENHKLVVYIVAGQQQDFKSLLQKRILNRST